MRMRAGVAKKGDSAVLVVMHDPRAIAHADGRIKVVDV